jgi:hypothetical protein
LTAKWAPKQFPTAGKTNKFFGFTPAVKHDMFGVSTRRPVKLQKQVNSPTHQHPHVNVFSRTETGNESSAEKFPIIFCDNGSAKEILL